MAEPLISILIPFKNTEAYISDCVLSILNQNYTHWEAIFINDTSEDNSIEILKVFSTKHSKIKCIDNEGKGIIEALRTGYKQSNGSYITRMDSDDIMAPKRLQMQVQSLKTYGKKHVALGLVKYFRADGLSNGYINYEHWLNTLTKTGNNYSEIYKECVIPSPCWMLHRTDFEACGGFLSNRYPEDYDLAFRFYKAGFTCIPCNTVLLHWRDYSNRTSRTHIHYAQNSFLDLKVHYFLELDYKLNPSLVLWGAGAKGKATAKLLISNNIEFYWVCDNQKKIGKTIYNTKLKHFNHIETLSQPQIIVTVANIEAQQSIKQYLKTQGLKLAIDYFFFC